MNVAETVPPPVSIRPTHRYGAVSARATLRSLAERDDFEAVRLAVCADAIRLSRDGREPSPSEVHVLATSLRETMRELDERIGQEWFSVALRAHDCFLRPHARNGILWADELAAELLDEIGDEGRVRARQLRESSLRRWSSLHGQGSFLASELPIAVWEVWYPNPVAPIIATLFALTLWLDRVWPKIKRQRDIASRTPTALSLPLVEEVTKQMRPGVQYLNGRLIGPDGVTIGELVGPIVEVPITDLAVLEDLTARGAALLCSTNGFRLVWWLADTARRQFLEGHPTPWMIEVSGGWEELALRVSSESRGMQIETADRHVAADLKAISLALARRMDFRLPDGSVGNLLVLRWSPARRGHRGTVRFELSGCWLPHYVVTLPRHTLPQRRARLLVPVLPPPPAIGNPRTHAAQASLAWDLVAEMTRQSREVARVGGLPMSRDLRLMLERRNGVTREATADLVWSHWRNLGFIDEPEPGLVRIGERHPEAWRLIVKGGDARNAAAAAGHGNATKKSGFRG